MTAATRGAQPLDASFTASIEKDGAFASYLELPGSDDLLGTRRAVGRRHDRRSPLHGHSHALRQGAPLAASAGSPLQDHREVPGRRESCRTPAAAIQLTTALG